MPTWVRAAGLLLAVVVLHATAGYAQTVPFTDNFEDGAADGWTKYQGTWSVVVDGTYVYRQSGLSSKYRAAAGSAAWKDYVVEARVKPTGWNGTDRFASLVARFQDGNNMYALALRSSNKVALIKIASGANTVLAQTAYSVTLNTWYTLKLEVTDSTLRGYVNGILQVAATDSTFATGRIGARTEYASANFDDFVVTTGGPPVNQPPQVQAGPDQVVILPDDEASLPVEASLLGQVTDDGLPGPPDHVSCVWTQTAGPPDQVTFTPSSDELTFTPSSDELQPTATTASFRQVGSYTVRLTCDDPELEGFDDVNITVLNEDEPLPPGEAPIG
jgi:pectate lyase